ncbi:hypothetical protein Leryth_016828 [Lithospermum erythrorhizon]|nr:hypothetical protein Leryth_016828 [Lithospermum erythrorhizon]
MEAKADTRSVIYGPGQKQENIGPGLHYFGSEELRLFMPPPPPDSATSFTALLELPPIQAVELLVHSPENITTPPPPTAAEEEEVMLAGREYSFHGFAPPPPPPENLNSPPPPPPSLTAAEEEEEVKFSGGEYNFHGFAPPLFPGDMELIGRAAKFSVFAPPENSPESLCCKKLKQEQVDSDFNPSDTTFQTPTNKRKGRDKKVKESNKRNKPRKRNLEMAYYMFMYGHKLGGQATDSHSLAERARREKINARMKLLQELVPGCNKISGTASVLDEIINHVQSLQRQVEFLSMRLAAVNPGIDINLDTFMTAENGSLVESNYYPGITMPSVWPEEQIRPQYQQLWQLDGFQQSAWIKEEDNSNFVPP